MRCWPIPAAMSVTLAYLLIVSGTIVAVIAQGLMRDRFGI